MKILSVSNMSGTYKEMSDMEFKELSKESIPLVLTVAGENMRGSAMLNAIMESLSREYVNRVDFYYMIPEWTNVKVYFGLLDTASVFLMCRGEIIDYQTGLTPKHKLRMKIEDFLNKISR